MELLILSDLHLGPDTGNRSEKFLQFLSAASLRKAEVIIVGDLFELWFGWPDLTFSYQKEILAELKRFARSGLIIDFVEGNRDFGIARYKTEYFRNVYAKQMRKKLGSRLLHIEHGDLVNQKDRQYRVWRALTKSPVAFAIPSLLPSKTLLRLSSSLEKKLQKTNTRYKSQYPAEQCRRFYEKQFDSGADVVIIGHLHEKREELLRRAGKDVLFYVLPGWEEGFQFLVVPDTIEKPHFEDLGR